jgi:hypothetical protein
MANKRQIPPVERVTDDQARVALSALKERVEDMDGVRGGNMTTAVTKKDLVDAGLVEIDNRGTLTKREEDEQVPFKDQSLKTLASNIDLIATANVGIAPGVYNQFYQQQQTDLLNECKAKINELIDAIRTGKFQ